LELTAVQGHQRLYFSRHAMPRNATHSRNGNTALLSGPWMKSALGGFVSQSLRISGNKSWLKHLPK